MENTTKDKQDKALFYLIYLSVSVFILACVRAVLHSLHFAALFSKKDRMKPQYMKQDKIDRGRSHSWPRAKEKGKQLPLIGQSVGMIVFSARLEASSTAGHSTSARGPCLKVHSYQFKRSCLPRQIGPALSKVSFNLKAQSSRVNESLNRFTSGPAIGSGQPSTWPHTTSKSYVLSVQHEHILYSCCGK